MEYEAGGAPEPVWTLQRREKSLSRIGIRTPNRLTRSLVDIVRDLLILLPGVVKAVCSVDHLMPSPHWELNFLYLTNSVSLCYAVARTSHTRSVLSQNFGLFCFGVGLPKICSVGRLVYVLKHARCRSRSVTGHLTFSIGLIDNEILVASNAIKYLFS